MVPGRPRRRSLSRRSLIAAAAGGLGALRTRRAEAGTPSLSTEDLARLAEGEVVHVPLDLDLDQGSYFGGVAYAIVHAGVADVARILNDPSCYASILPKTLECRVLGRRGSELRVFLRQGGRAGSAAYTLFVRCESLGLVRFWLDPSENHDVADLWGYFSVKPWRGGASLLTYAALVRLDFGVVKLLFSEVIRRYALSTPGLVRAFVEAHAAARVVPIASPATGP